VWCATHGADFFAASRSLMEDLVQCEVRIALPYSCTYVIAIAHNHRGAHSTKRLRATSNFVRVPEPFHSLRAIPTQSAEDNDAGHMESPARKLETTHLSLAHGVEEKLKIPRCSRHS